MRPLCRSHRHMAVYNLPPDDDPEAQWVARLNYLGQLIDEQAGLDAQGTPGPDFQPSRELQALMARWRGVANPDSVPPPPPKQLSLL